MDITADCLNERLNETIFMEQPQLNLNEKTDKVCLPDKSLYDLH